MLWKIVSGFTLHVHHHTNANMISRQFEFVRFLGCKAVENFMLISMGT